MSKSTWISQQCKCGSGERAKIAISVAAATLGVVPRRKSKTITLYLCSRCTTKPKPKTVHAIAAAVVTAATKANRRPHRAKPRAAKMSSGAHRRPNSGPRNAAAIQKHPGENKPNDTTTQTARSRKRLDTIKRAGSMEMGEARPDSNRLAAFHHARRHRQQTS
jgi:hypothetical protein